MLLLKVPVGQQVFVVHEPPRHFAFINDGNTLRRYEFDGAALLHGVDSLEAFDLTLTQVDLETGNRLS
jgi:hypothetical protein